MIKYILIIILLLSLTLFLITRDTKHKYFLCIVAIFKNEESYINEWIDHHRNQGVDHFYLYCNDPNFNKYNIIGNDITIIDWTNKINMEDGNSIQKQAYYDCVKKYSNDTKYLMLLDIDEFLFPENKNIKSIDIIKNYPKNDKIISIRVPRYDYGSNGHKIKPNGNIVDNYKKREKICSSFKTIINTKYINKNIRFYKVHDFQYSNYDGKIYNKNFNYDLGYPSGCYKNFINESGLMIKHYFTKSFEEYIDRCNMWKNGGVNAGGFRKDCDIKKYNLNEETKNEIDD